MASNDGDRILLRFDDKEIIVSTVDNSASRALMEMLPLRPQFQDHVGTEKISHLTGKLDSSDVPAGYDPSVGDLTLYAPRGNLALFYRDLGYARGLVPLGTIVSGLEFLEDIDEGGPVHVEPAEWPKRR
jgi:hypothetical protein